MRDAGVAVYEVQAAHVLQRYMAAAPQPPRWYGRQPARPGANRTLPQPTDDNGGTPSVDGDGGAALGHVLGVHDDRRGRRVVAQAASEALQHLYERSIAPPRVAAAAVRRRQLSAPGLTVPLTTPAALLRLSAEGRPQPTDKGRSVREPRRSLE